MKQNLATAGAFVMMFVKDRVTIIGVVQFSLHM